MKKISAYWKTWKALTIAIICTIIWFGLFPVFGLAAMTCGMVATKAIERTLCYLGVLISLSPLATIVCIWVFYFRKKTRLMYLSNLIPIVTLITLGVMITLLEKVVLKK